MNKTDLKPDLPLWDLSPVYKGFDDPSYAADRDRLTSSFQDLLDTVEKNSGSMDENWLENVIKKSAQAESIYENLYSFCYANYSVETANSRALKELNFLEKEKLKFYRAKTAFRKKFAMKEQDISELAARNSFFAEYTLFLKETAELKKHQLSEEMEDLIEELLQPGANSWSRLQEAVSSDLSVKWGKKTGDRKTVTELRSLAFESDRKTRKKAYKQEIEAWQSVEIPLAYALNGVKGFGLILNRRRGWSSALEKSAFQSRIPEDTVKALTGAMEKSLPFFHKYLETKAALLGLKKLSFYDLFAPLPENTPKDGLSSKSFPAETGSTENKLWSFTDAKRFIIDTFRSFSDEMGEFAEKSFRKNWIDAMPRKGKVGGAYCINFPLAKESRILCNYNSTFTSVSTVAHELGHAWHAEVLKNESQVHQNYPMTLAETASIFSEILVFDTAIRQAPPSEKIFIMEIFLQELTQVIVDILSRFYFEKSVFKKRKDGELTAQEFSLLMREAQKKTYGRAVEKQSYHQYMWAVKGHYYIPGLSFYNYPYAFGQLFGIALYREYLKDKTGFPARYKGILMMSGKASAAEIAAKAGFNIESESFWLDSLSYIHEIIGEFSAASFKGDLSR